MCAADVRFDATSVSRHHTIVMFRVCTAQLHDGVRCAMLRGCTASTWEERTRFDAT